MIRTYNNDFEGLSQYLSNHWEDKNVQGSFQLINTGQEQLHPATEKNKIDGNIKTQEVQVVEKREGKISMYRISLMIQRQSGIITLTLPSRNYTFNLSKVSEYKRSLLDIIKGREGRQKSILASSITDFSFSHTFHDTLTFSEKVELDKFIEDFSLLNQFILDKIHQVVEGEISQCYGGLPLKCDYLQNNYLTLSLDNVAFKVEIK